MPKAGYCDVCGENVWIESDGTCAKGGHGSEHISDVHQQDPASDSAPAAAPSQGSPRRRRQLGPKIALTLAILLSVLLLCGILTAIVVPAFNTPHISATKRACFANQRALLAAFKSYRANGGKDVVTLDDLVAQGYLSTIPKCPEGGQYVWNPVTHDITCTVHGTVQGVPVQ